jgi:hypothetical protein
MYLISCGREKSAAFPNPWSRNKRRKMSRTLEKERKNPQIPSSLVQDDKLSIEIMFSILQGGKDFIRGT